LVFFFPDKPLSLLAFKGWVEMSYLLPHLHSGWAVDQAILAEEERVVIIRFGHDWDDTCMQVPNPPLLASSFFLFLIFFKTTNIVILCNGKLDHGM